MADLPHDPLAGSVFEDLEIDEPHEVLRRFKHDASGRYPRLDADIEWLATIDHLGQSVSAS